MLRLRVNKVCRSDEKRWIWLLPNAPGGRRPRELRTRYGEKWPRQPVRERAHAAGDEERRRRCRIEHEDRRGREQRGAAGGGQRRAQGL